MPIVVYIVNYLSIVKKKNKYYSYVAVGDYP